MAGRFGPDEVGSRRLVILIDTTVWIDLFADRNTPGTRKLTSAIEADDDLATCGFVLTEVLQGIREGNRFSQTKKILEDLIYLPTSQSAYVSAALIYRGCRHKGLTIRKPVDCMIAATCIEHSCFILHNDRDFSHISKHFPLQSV